MAQLTRDTLFVGLTRPQMLAGVTYSFVILNGVVTTELFLILKSPWVIAAALFLHAIGMAACYREPRVFELWRVKLAHCRRVRTWSVWRCNTYHP